MGHLGPIGAQWGPMGVKDRFSNQRGPGFGNWAAIRKPWAAIRKPGRMDSETRIRKRAVDSKTRIRKLAVDSETRIRKLGLDSETRGQRLTVDSETSLPELATPSRTQHENPGPGSQAHGPRGQRAHKPQAAGPRGPMHEPTCPHRGRDHGTQGPMRPWARSAAAACPKGQGAQCMSLQCPCSAGPMGPMGLMGFMGSMGPQCLWNHWPDRPPRRAPRAQRPNA